MDPIGVERGWGGGLEILDAAEYDGTWCGVWSPSQLRSMVELFQLFPVLSVWELQNHFPYRPGPAPSARGCAEEVMRVFPVFAIVLGGGSAASKSIQLLAVDAVGGRGSAYFWSMMHMGATEQFDTGDMTFNIDEDDCDMVSDDDIASADSSVDKPVGRPRLEDKRRFGRAVVDFVESCISARGQHTVDRQRMKPITGVFGAPLQAIAAAVQEHFGQTVSRDGIWNLLAPPRRNSIGAVRGLVNARPVRVVATEKKNTSTEQIQRQLIQV